MKISSWNWASHPHDELKTKGWVVGPFFGVMTYTSMPAIKGRYGLTLQFKRWPSNA